MSSHQAIYFHNPGLIEIDAITTMGVSVKDCDTPTGYFGTGLKFAIATVLREGGSINLWRGNDQYEFTTQQKVIRGTEFQVVTMNGESLGFTTQMGKNWRPWMAYRELACNAFDEGGAVSDLPVQPSMGTTLLVVDCRSIRRAHIDRKSFLIAPNETPLYGDVQCEAYPTKEGGGFLFYRGIRVSTEQYRSCFRYNTLCDIELTEDRTAKYTFQVTDPIAAMWLGSDSEMMLREVLSTPDDFLEHRLDWVTCGATPGNVWVETVAKLGRENVPLSESVERAYERCTNHSPTLPSEGMALRPAQRQALSDALGFLDRAGFVVKDHPVIVTDRLGRGVLGRAAHGNIYLSIEAFMMGDSTLAGTILEEWIHLTRGLKDCCRPMQNWLFDALIEQAKRADFAETTEK